MQTRTTMDRWLAERVGFEPTNTVRCYTLSRRAPSTARPPLLAAARVPEATHAIKFKGGRLAGGASRCLAGGASPGASLAAGRLVGRRGLVLRRNVETDVLRPRRRRRKFHGRNDQGTLRIRRIQARGHLQRRYLPCTLILLRSMTIGRQLTEQVAAATERRGANQYQNSIKAHAAWSSRVTPALCIARSTVSRCAADSSTNGRRIAFPMRPILATAHLTGIGLASTNKSLCKDCNVASIARALSRSPARAAAQASCMRRGATLAVTEMTPRAPTHIQSMAVASSPDRIENSGGHASRVSRARLRDPVASLIATIFGLRARRATVLGNRSTAVRLGTLYRITGTAEASAAALKCLYRPSWGGLL